MNQQKFFTGAVSTCFLVAVLSASSCTVLNAHKRAETAKEMVKQGIDPLDIPCANETGTERYCELRAATKALISKGDGNE